MKHLKLFFALFAMLALGVGNAWAEEVTETITMKNFGGLTTGSLIYQTKPGLSDKGTGMVAFAFTPSTGQVRGNKTGIVGASVTTDQTSHNWSLYNSDPMAGVIKAIKVTQTATGTNKFQNNLYVSLGTSSQGEVTAVTNAQKQDAGGTAQEINFTIDPSKGYTYFKLLSNEKFTSGTVAGVIVTVTYETAGGGENPGEGGGEDPTPDPEEPGEDGDKDGETYELVTSISDLETGAKYIVGNSASTSSIFMSTEINTNNRKVTSAITITDNKVTITEDVLILELGGETGAWTFKTTNYLGTQGFLTSAASGKNNYCKVVATAEACSYFTIAFNNQEAIITSTGRDERNILRYNGSNGSSLFACYSSGQSPVYLYKLTTSSGGDEGGSGETVPSLTQEEFSWSATTATATLPDQFDPKPTLTNTEKLVVSYSSSKEDVATIDEEGNVKLVGKGETIISATAGDDETYKKTTVSYTLTVKPAPLVIEPIVGGIVDILTIEDLKITGSGSYTYFTDKQASNSGHSNAVYAGTAARNGNSTKYNIQLNSGETNSKGRQIATTISGGIAKRVYVRWATQKDNTNNRYLTIYGKNEAYNGVETEASGTEIGKITYTTGSAEAYVDLSSDCKYIKIGASDAIYMDEIQITWIADQSALTAPTFTPAAGTYNAVQNVTISAEEGTTIYYTLDGTDPTTTPSNVYASAIEISETTTVKAIAVKDEKVSPIASAKYTINLPLTTMDQIFAKASDVKSTATPVEITFGNWVVSAVKEDGKTAFVTDGTKGFVIFDKDVNLGFSVGNILSKTTTCKVELYNGFAELTELKSTTTGLSVATGGEINVVELDADGIAALTGVNTGSLVKINGICTQSGSNYYVAGVQVYSSLYTFGTLEVGAEYNITGIYQPYNSTKEILPRSAADIEKVVGLPTATISIADITMEIGQEKTIEPTITPDAAQSKVQYAITSGNEYITLSGTTITAVAAGKATITATIIEKADEYKGATKEFTVTVKPQNIAVLPFTFNGGKADIENTLGMSQTGLDDDYNSAPKLKFNGAGDNVIIHFDSQAGEFSFVLKQNGQNAGTFTVYESANGDDYTPVWSGGDFGNAQSETIKPTLSESARYVKFEYTTKGTSTNYALGSISIAKPDNREEARLAWDPSSVTLTQGDAFTAPTLSNPHSVSGITYKSSNEEVATVTAEGEIALASAIGTATITATFDGDATYKPAIATCTITVNEYIETIDGEWQLVTDASKLQAGMEIIIASVEVDGKYYAMSKASDNGNNRTAVESTISGDKLNPAVGTSVLTLVDAGNGTFALQAGNGKYLYAASSTSNHLKEKDKIDVNGQWTITIADSKATIKAEASSNRNWIRYNNSSNMFSCYASGQQDIALYAKVPEHRRTTSAGRYGTICLPGNIVKCLGATLYEVAGKDGLRVVFDEVLTPEAGMPYIFLAHNAEVLFYCGDQTAAAGNHNSLHGTFTVLQNTELEGKYMVQNNKIVKCNPANSGVAAYRAYFNGTELEALGSAPAPMPGRRRITMGTESENTATGTEDVIAPEGQTLKLIENGQLIIIRGGEKFNAQGQKL